MDGRDYITWLANVSFSLEQMQGVRRRFKVWTFITLIIVSMLPASLVAYCAGVISGKTALVTSLLVVILVRVLIGKPTFYSADAEKS